MTTTVSALGALLIAASLSGSALAADQTAPAVPFPMMGHGMGMMGMMGPSVTDPAQLDALKTRLAITPAQEGAWKAYADTLKAVPALDTSAIQAAKTPGERYDAMAKQHQARFEAMISVHKATADLYAVLDDQQKTNARFGMGHGPMMMGRGGCGGF